MKTAAYVLVIVSLMLQLSTASASSVEEALFSPDGTIVADPQQDCTVILWEVASGRKIGTLSDGLPPRGNLYTSRRYKVLSSFSPDGKWLATQCEYGPIIVWNVRAGRILGGLSGSFQEALTLQFSPDSRLILSVGDACDKGTLCPNTITVWEASTQKELLSVNLGIKAGVKRAVLSPDGKTVMAVIGQKITREAEPNTYITSSIKLWDIDRAEELTALKCPSGASASFSPDGRFLLITEPHGPRIWDIRASKEGYLGRDFSTSLQSNRVTDSLRTWNAGRMYHLGDPQ
jgi:WD40 repeat protein